MTTAPQISLPAIMAITVGASTTAILTEDGEILTAPNHEAAALIKGKPVLLCHAPYTRQRLQTGDFYAFDLLELFAFVHPATFCIPTPHGLCDILNLPKPTTPEDVPFSLLDIARTLLEHLQYDQLEAKAPATDIAGVMGMQGKGWPWTPYIFEACGTEYDPTLQIHSKIALNVWKHLPEWEDEPPRPPPDHHPITTEEALTRLGDLLQNGPDKVEPRPQQKDYAAHITHAFTPRDNDDEPPHIALAEAGTGTGKTLGYLAPASLWAEKNNGAVWVSTYTKNLQRQIARELDRLYPNSADKDKNIAIRKGRENYLCLLNLEENAAGATTAHNPQYAIAAGIMARWAAASKDGDLSGADYPGWLSGLLGHANTTGLADKRGECIYSACDHYKKCFSEHSVRGAKSAKIVIANHALVMIQSAMATGLETLPSRYIFDEGHHLFDAADSAFAAHLTAQETRDMRRWILGNEGGKRGRARGLKRRAEDLCLGNEEAEPLLQDILDAATILTNDGWTRRMKNSAPQGPAEELLHAVMSQVYARTDGQNSPYSLETSTRPIAAELLPVSAALSEVFKTLMDSMKRLAKNFITRLQDDEGLLDTDTRKRLESVSNALNYRSIVLQAWINTLESLTLKDTPPEFVDWMEVTRTGGQAIDVGIMRHWVDPMKPFAETIKPHLHGMAITSATLRDQDTDNDWTSALTLTGSRHITPAPAEFSISSPFDYPQQTQVFIITDVNKNDARQVAGAFASLFQASGGGGLGLFTAISRLRKVHELINAPLENANIPLYAQHIDDIDIGTLLDMFKFEPNSCMLGTDATRDGVDIPGDSLRMLVFDRVPWPRPTLLHKARRAALGGRAYDEMITRLKLKQAFGRLIRRENDKGVFVMLDSGLPSRLHTAFPEGTTIHKIGLAEACKSIHTFLEHNK